MRRVAAGIALTLLVAPLQALEEPFVLQAGVTNVVKLPEKSETLWLGLANDLRPNAEISATNLTTNQLTVSIIDQGNGSFAVPLPPSEIPFIAACRLKAGGQWRQIHPILIDTGPVVTTTNFSMGSVYKGILDEGAVSFSVAFAHPNQFESFEVVANRIGSSLDSTLRLLGRKGETMHENDDDLFAGRDSFLSVATNQKQNYTLRLSDRANASGAEYFFCLRTSQSTRVVQGALLSVKTPSPIFVGSFHDGYGQESEPNDRPASADKLALDDLKAASSRIQGGFGKSGDIDWFEFKVRANQKIVARIETRKFDSPCDAGLALYNENGKLIAESVGAEEEGPSITNRFSADGLARLEIRELSRGVGSYWLALQEFHPGVVLSTETERVSFSKEGEAKLKIACKRFDTDSPVTIRIEGLPDGVEVIDAVVPEKKNEVQLRLKRSREVPAFQMRIFGAIQDGKEEFPVSTMPALKKLYPLQMFPCAAMESWIAVNPPPSE